MSLLKLVVAIKGGKGSGNFDHAGRPGHVGGSVTLSPFANHEDSFTEQEYESIARQSAKDDTYELAALIINGHGRARHVELGDLHSGDNVDISGLEAVLGRYNREGIIQDAAILHTHPTHASNYSPFGIMADLQVFDKLSRHAGLNRMVIYDGDGNRQTLTAKSNRPDQFSIISYYQSQLRKELTKYQKQFGTYPDKSEQQDMLKAVNAKVAKAAGITYTID